MGEPPVTPPLEGTPPPEDRLDSWKEIAGYLKRDVTTVQRWEKREGMPVHRHLHDKLGSVYAYRSELANWMQRRNPGPVPEATDTTDADLASDGPAPPPSTPRRVSPSAWLVTAGALLVAAGATWWFVHRTDAPWRNPLDDAQFRMATDFDGTEQAAAVSRDGKFVAFTSDRDGPMDVWVSQVSTGQFYNLTRGRVRQLVNPSVRTLGFSPDGSLVTFWARGVEGASGDDIGIWAIPTLGGQPKSYLQGAAEFDWSRDGSRLVYHTPGPGDPMFVGSSDQQIQPRPIFAAPAGLHAHFPTWSPDGAFIYFVQGSVPDAMDIWRIRPSGEGAERITNHSARVSHPILLDDRTLMYLAAAGDGSGARLHTLDVQQRVARALGTSLDRYTSLAVSADGRRVAATLANPKRTIWRLPVGEQSAVPSTGTLIPLPTGRGFSPRLGPGCLLYVSSQGTGDGIWKLTEGAATELWSATDTRIFGGPEVSPEGQRVAFSVERRGKTLLYVMNVDGTNVQVVSESLQLHGAPAWAHDGQSLASGATVEGSPHLLRIMLDGSPVPIVRDFAVDPVWSPAGDFVVYSGADIGTEFPVKAVTVDGRPYEFPKLTLTRGARRVRFLQGRRALVTMRGDLQHKDLWLIDVESGQERRLTHLPPDFNIRDFDVSSDGRDILVERVQENSDVVLIDLGQRRAP